MTTELIRYNIAAGQEEAFLQAYQEAGQIMQRSPECLGYDVIRGVEEPNHFVVIIHWVSVERHLEGFRKSAEFSVFFAAVKPFFTSIEEMKHYETQDSYKSEAAV